MGILITKVELTDIRKTANTNPNITLDSISENLSVLKITIKVPKKDAIAIGRIYAINFFVYPTKIIPEC